MEANEYATLFAQEEEFWWYLGLRRLVEERTREALVPATAAVDDGRDDDGGARRGAGRRPRRILDAGCGTGGMLARLARQGEVTGMDFSKLALGFARRRDVAPLLRGSVERLPFQEETFDLIVSLDVLYHRGVSSDLAALREFRRCLRPGGRIVLNLPAFEALRSSHDAAIHTARRYRREPLRALLVEAELEPVRITYWNTILFPALAAVRLLRRRGHDAIPAEGARGENGRTPPAPPGVSGPVSDVRPIPGPLNSLFGALLGVERIWLRHADLPCGLSLLAIARRPGNAA